MCGYLWKRGGLLKRWVKRYFILSESILYYFLDAEDVDIRGFITLNYVKIEKSKSKRRNATIYPKEGHSIIKTAKFKQNGGLSLGNHKQMHLRASSRQEMDDWMSALVAAINHANPVHKTEQAQKDGLRKSLRLSGDFVGLKVANVLKAGVCDAKKKEELRRERRHSVNLTLQHGRELVGESPLRGRKRSLSTAN